VSGWRPALQIARRTVRRSLARSLLVAILVGLPVAAATFVDVLVRTQSNPERQAARTIGSADASVEVTPLRRLKHYTPNPWAGYADQGAQRDVRDVDVESMLPPGARLAAVPIDYEVRVDNGDGVVRTWLQVADVTDELARHEAELVEGTAPGDGEVLVSAPLAERLGLLDDGELVPGASVTLHDGVSASVSGLSRSAFCLSCERMVAMPGSTVHRAADAEGSAQSDLGDGAGNGIFLVDLPAGTDLETLWTDLAAHGVALVPRDAYINPEKYDALAAGGGIEVSPEAVAAAALAALIVGLGLLEVVLLAGTAFAVGARRQVRELGVVAAAGATGKQIRRIVLAQGVVLGLLGSAIGIAFGAAAAVLGKPVWQRLDDALITDWQFGPLEIAGAAVVGTVSGLLAAVIPAIGAARMAPVDALSGRFRVSRAQRRRAPMIGATLAAVGATCGVLGDRLLADEFAEYRSALAAADPTGQYVSAPTPAVPLLFVVGGATLVVAGLVILAPVLIGWIGRAGGLLPLSGRLAVRDAARHRHRTGPATSAIAVAVAGSIVLAFVVAGNGRAQELQYVPSLPDDTMSVYAWDTTDPAAVQAEAAATAARELPGAEIVTLRDIAGRDIAGRDITGAGVAEGDEPGLPTVSVEERFDPATCAVGCVSSAYTIAVANDRLVRLVVGADAAAEARGALAAGRVVVTAESQLDPRGRVHLIDDSTGKTTLQPGHLIERARYDSIPSALISPPALEAAGWRPVASRTLITYAASATPDQVDTALTAAEESGAEAAIETGPGGETSIVLLIAAIAAGFVTLVGVAISVALSAAEGRADLATLAAVGAPPRRRRSLAAAQALLVGGLGCLLGLGLGTFVSVTLRATTGAPELVVPWLNLAAVGLAVPLLAVLVAALLTPSRLPLARRSE
jgi:putative ABC transport system permease protein